MAEVTLFPGAAAGSNILNRAFKPTPERVSARELKGETIILDLKSDVYYYLNSVGTFIWSNLDGVKTGRELIHLVLREFEAPLSAIETDIEQLLTDLLAMGLVVEGNS